jgi:hypothetical protein
MNLINSEDCIPTWTLRTTSEESQETPCRECWKVDGNVIYTHIYTQICVCIICVYAPSFPHTEHSFCYILMLLNAHWPRKDPS